MGWGVRGAARAAGSHARLPGHDGSGRRPHRPRHLRHQPVRGRRGRRRPGRPDRGRGVRRGRLRRPIGRLPGRHRRGVRRVGRRPGHRAARGGRPSRRGGGEGRRRRRRPVLRRHGRAGLPAPHERSARATHEDARSAPAPRGTAASPTASPASTSREAAGRRHPYGGALGVARGHRRAAGLRTGAPRGPRCAGHLARAQPVPARALPDDVHHPALDGPAVRRVLDGRGLQRVLPAQPRGGPEGPERRVRPRDPPRLRLRSPAGPWRRRHGRRRDRLDLRRPHALRRHPARPDVGVDDDERRGAAGDGALHRGGAGAGGGAGTALGDDPERHPQGVHGPQHLHLPAVAEHADHLRHLLVHRRADAALQLDLDLRLPHAGGRGDRRPRARLHARRRRGVPPGRPRRGARHRPVRTAASASSGRSG